MVSDARMRAHLLTTIYALRDNNNGWVPTSDMNFGGFESVSSGRIRSVCEQLVEANLIAFKPLPGGPDGGLVGMSKITGHGCDVVDGLAKPRLVLDFSQKAQSDATSPIGEVASRSDASMPVQRTGEIEEHSAHLQSSMAPGSDTEVITLKLTLWGMSIDLKEAYRRVRRWSRKKA